MKYTPPPYGSFSLQFRVELGKLLYSSEYKKKKKCLLICIYYFYSLCSVFSLWTSYFVLAFLALSSTVYISFMIFIYLCTFLCISSFCTKVLISIIFSLIRSNELFSLEFPWNRTMRQDWLTWGLFGRRSLETLVEEPGSARRTWRRPLWGPSSNKLKA